MQISKSLESNGLVKKLSVWQSLNISQKTVPYSCLWWLLCCFSVKTCCPYHQLTAIGMTIHSDSGILTNTLPQLREWIAATPNQTLEGLQVIFKLECSHSESTQYEAYCAHWTQQTLPQKYRNIGPQMKTLILSHTVSRRYAKNNESFIQFRFYYFLENYRPRVQQKLSKFCGLPPVQIRQWSWMAGKFKRHFTCETKHLTCNT